MRLPRRAAAYEYVFNAAYQLETYGLRRQAPLTYVSAEPFTGHVGIGGLPDGEILLSLFFKTVGIRGRGIFDVAMEEVAPGALRLADGRTLPFKYAMIVPPVLGAAVVKASSEQVHQAYELGSADNLLVGHIAGRCDFCHSQPSAGVVRWP